LVFGLGRADVHARRQVQEFSSIFIFIYFILIKIIILFVAGEFPFLF